MTTESKALNYLLEQSLNAMPFGVINCKRRFELITRNGKRYDRHRCFQYNPYIEKDNLDK
jgi:hypothetical protein